MALTGAPAPTLSSTSISDCGYTPAYLPGMQTLLWNSSFQPLKPTSPPAPVKHLICAVYEGSRCPQAGRLLIVIPLQVYHVHQLYYSPCMEEQFNLFKVVSPPRAVPPAVPTQLTAFGRSSTRPAAAAGLLSSGAGALHSSTTGATPSSAQEPPNPLRARPQYLLGGGAGPGPARFRLAPGRARRCSGRQTRLPPGRSMTQAEKGEAENGKDKERDREREQRGVKRPIVPAAVPESLQEVRPGAGLGRCSLPAGAGLARARPFKGLRTGLRKRREGSGWPWGPALTRCALCCFQQIQSNFIVVIHPGSTTLRLGRATDTLPAGIPHVIARRHKQQGQAAYRDSWLLRDGLSVSPASPRPASSPGWFGLLCVQCVCPSHPSCCSRLAPGCVCV